MEDRSRGDLEEGLRALDSLIGKSRKALEHLKPGTSQHTTLARRLRAFTLAREIIAEKLENLPASEN